MSGSCSLALRYKAGLELTTFKADEGLAQGVRGDDRKWNKVGAGMRTAGA